MATNMTATTVTRRTTAANAGDQSAGIATFELDEKTGIITFAGQNRQMWVLVYEGAEQKDLPTCGGIYTSTEDGGELICLRRCPSKELGIEAVTKHDRSRDMVHTCTLHRGNPSATSKIEFCIPSIWRLTETDGLWDVKAPVGHNVLEFLASLSPSEQLRWICPPRQHAYRSGSVKPTAAQWGYGVADFMQEWKELANNQHDLPASVKRSTPKGLRERVTLRVKGKTWITALETYGEMLTVDKDGTSQEAESKLNVVLAELAEEAPDTHKVLLGIRDSASPSITKPAVARVMLRKVARCMQAAEQQAEADKPDVEMYKLLTTPVSSPRVISKQLDLDSAVATGAAGKGRTTARTALAASRKFAEDMVGQSNGAGWSQDLTQESDDGDIGGYGEDLGDDTEELEELERDLARQRQEKMRQLAEAKARRAERTSVSKKAEKRKLATSLFSSAPCRLMDMGIVGSGRDVF